MVYECSGVRVTALVWCVIVAKEDGTDDEKGARGEGTDVPLDTSTERRLYPESPYLTDAGYVTVRLCLGTDFV